MVLVKQPGLEHVQDQGDGCELQEGEAEVPLNTSEDPQNPGGEHTELRVPQCRSLRT